MYGDNSQELFQLEVTHTQVSTSWQFRMEGKSVCKLMQAKPLHAAYEATILQEESDPTFEAEESQLQNLPYIEDFTSQEMAGLEQGDAELSYAEEEPLTDTLYIVDDSVGSYRVTGMFQNMQMEQGNHQPINQLLERPRVSFFDLSWSNW